MKRKFTTLVVLLFVSTIMVWGQSIHTVTSNADSGEGTLRELITNAASGDKVVIPGDFIITLESEITLQSRHLTIDGQGATVKVTEPGVSTWRLFNLSSGGSGTNTRDLTFENLTLLGGNVIDNGGVILLNKRVSLNMKNCVVKNGKAAKGGAIYVTATEKIEYFNLEGCTFEANENTGGNGAIYFKGVNATVKDCIFKSNTSSATSVLYFELANETEDPTTILSGCYFTNNSTSGSGESSASVYFKGATYNLIVDNCTFDSEISKGSIFFTNSSEKVVFTNCTFYSNNTGGEVGDTGIGRGVIYAKGANAKELVVTNCTFAGNRATRTNQGAAISSDNAATAVTLVNNIFAYNYGNNGSDGLHDIHLAATPEGTNNIVKGNRTVPGTIAFIYDSENPDNDSKLFASYTTDAGSNKIPVLDATTGTIALTGNSVAIAAGVTAYGDPSIIPTLDQRGEARSAISPCIGSYEYQTLTGMNTETAGNKFRYWSEGGNLSIISDNIQIANLYGFDGRLVTSIQLTEGLNTVSGLAKGFYLLNNQKIIIR